VLLRDVVLLPVQNEFSVVDAEIKLSPELGRQWEWVCSTVAVQRSSADRRDKNTAADQSEDD